MKSRTVRVDYLARVEGEGGINIKIKGDKVEDVKFRIFEPPRFFEAFLRGRRFTEAPDITARVCGICPVAYQTSSIYAMESICGVKVDPQVRELRRLLYCGEWIESHVLHVYMLHAPDFLGYEDAIQIAQDYPEVVTKGLKMKKLGNDIMNLVGGREIHPINMRVGGFYKTPSKKDLLALVEPLKWARDTAAETCRWVATFNFPDFEYDYEFVALRHEKEYPICEGRVVSSKGLNIDVSEYEQHFIEEHMEHANALHSVQVGKGPYFVGPLARINLDFDQLPKVAKEAATAAGFKLPCKNPFKSIVVRAIETVFACDEAIRIINQYEPPAKPYVDVKPRAGAGCGISEAPRGILFHRYKIDDDGIILDAKMVPPTSQNQRTIENDLRLFAGKNLQLKDDELTWQCEQAVRNYDPCISCATHALNLKIDRS
jgi:sulfhydrogenase subunit alpha